MADQLAAGRRAFEENRNRNALGGGRLRLLGNLTLQLGGARAQLVLARLRQQLSGPIALSWDQAGEKAKGRGVVSRLEGIHGRIHD